VVFNRISAKGNRELDKKEVFLSGSFWAIESADNGGGSLIIDQLDASYLTMDCFGHG
jgi:hypothetical protein